MARVDETHDGDGDEHWESVEAVEVGFVGWEGVAELGTRCVFDETVDDSNLTVLVNHLAHVKRRTYSDQAQ